MQDHPQPAFERLERVTFCGERFTDETGTVIWRDLFTNAETKATSWMYIVHTDLQNAYRSCLETELKSIGQFDSEESFLGASYEISFDVILGDDNSFVEGTYRLPGRFWEVLIMSKRDVLELECKPSTWHSGITGRVFHVPEATVLNREFVLEALRQFVQDENWRIVAGPDSIILR